MVLMTIKKRDFNEKLSNINNKSVSNKTKQIDAYKKLTDHIASYTKLINDLSREVRLISTKGLTKDLINAYSILNGTKYFAEDESQNYLVFQPVFNYFKRLSNDSRNIAWKFDSLSERSFKFSHRSNILGPGLNYINNAKI